MTNAIAAIPAGPIGLENVTSQDLILPYIILLQPLSKLSVQDGMPAGVFANTLSRKNLGKSIEIIPFKMSRYIDLLRPEGDRMIFETRITDEKDSRLEGRRFFRDGDLKANAMSVISIMASVSREPALIKFAKSSYRAGKELITLAKIAGNAFFSRKYTLSSKMVSGENTYFIIAVSDAGPASAEEQQQAYALYRNFGGKAKDINESAPAPDDESVPF